MPDVPEIPTEIFAGPEPEDHLDKRAEEHNELGIRFRRLLPIAQLLLCAVLLFPYRALILFQLFGIRGAGPLPPSSITYNLDGSINLRTDDAFERWFQAKENAYDFATALNLPVVLVEVPHIILSADRSGWTPHNIDFKTWRAVTWPLLGLPLWWMAGRGLEALLAARRNLASPRIGWPATVISFLLMGAGLIVAIGFILSSTAADRADHEFRIFSAAAGMWGVLGSFTVIAKLSQWRITKHASHLPERICKTGAPR